jgi:hypothetical protein
MRDHNSKHFLHLCYLLLCSPPSVNIMVENIDTLGAQIHGELHDLISNICLLYFKYGQTGRIILFIHWSYLCSWIREGSVKWSPKKLSTYNVNTDSKWGSNWSFLKAHFYNLQNKYLQICIRLKFLYFIIQHNNFHHEI